MTTSNGIFGVPLGVDFPNALVTGLVDRFGSDPIEMAQTTLLLNTQRMARRVGSVFDAGPARLLPRIGLVTDPAQHFLVPALPPAVSPLRRRLEVSQLVSHLLDSQPDLAPRASLYDLSDSLVNLMEEMQGEGVDPSVLRTLDVSDESGHWRRALSFVEIVQQYFGDHTEDIDRERRNRMVVEQLIESWETTPPEHPVIIAGSTASRGTTKLLMKAVAKLPKGMLVLPGFDFDMPAPSWTTLDDALTAEDHPQYRYAKLMDELDLPISSVASWSNQIPPNKARNKLVSLALRPAPVTDSWLTEGPSLTDLSTAMEKVTLVEADSQRNEALAIALRLRQAVEDGQTAALITPDRILTRQVTAALARWKIQPDDSAGIPLQLTAPGRFLRHISALFHRKLDAEALLTLLMHPLTHTGGSRGIHLRLTREFELWIRKNGAPFPDADVIRRFAAAQDEPMSDAWGEWVVTTFVDRLVEGQPALIDHLTTQLSIAEQAADGSAPTDQSELWKADAGETAQRVLNDLNEQAVYGGALSALDYADLFGAVLAQHEVRNPNQPHPNVLIWGTLEARVQGAGLVILGGLNEGSWPQSPSPDPWLNRRMRLDAGMLLPERRIGLSAHDFQQAIGAPEVWLTRSIRSDDAETVASRWINRLSNLLEGLPDQGGKAAIEASRQQGVKWLEMAKALEKPGETPPAPRPSPQPPIEARPRQLSVTEVKKLIRDPYAIYARHILRLRPLDPLMRAPDALLRGTVVHLVLETFIHNSRADETLLNAGHLREVAQDVLTQHVPWSDTRALWLARISRIADWFVETERARRERATPMYFEESGVAQIPEIGFTLKAKADRIDIDDRGFAHIYDYKTGTPPSKAQQASFDKQLLLEAAMVENGGFGRIGPSEVSEALFIGVGPKPTEVSAPLSEETPDAVWEKFKALIQQYFDPDQGFTARRAPFKDAIGLDYDGLSRWGEWDATTPATKVKLT